MYDTGEKCFGRYRLPVRIVILRSIKRPHTVILHTSHAVERNYFTYTKAVSGFQICCRQKEYRIFAGQSAP